MAIRATESDVAREPRLGEVGVPVAYDGDRPTVWLVNALDEKEPDGIGGCQFFERTDGTGRCTIHPTRPDVCRRLDCDALAEIAANHLAEWRAALAARERAEGADRSE